MRKRVAEGLWKHCFPNVCFSDFCRHVHVNICVHVYPCKIRRRFNKLIGTSVHNYDSATMFNTLRNCAIGHVISATIADCMFPVLIRSLPT